MFLCRGSFFTPRGNAATSATCSRLFVQCHRRRSRDRLCELCFGSETVLSLCFARKSNPPTIATFNIQSHTQNSNWTRQYTTQPNIKNDTILSNNSTLCGPLGFLHTSLHGTSICASNAIRGELQSCLADELVRSICSGGQIKS